MKVAKQVFFTLFLFFFFSLFTNLKLFANKTFLGITTIRIKPVSRESNCEKHTWWINKNAASCCTHGKGRLENMRRSEAHTSHEAPAPHPGSWVPGKNPLITVFKARSLCPTQSRPHTPPSGQHWSSGLFAAYGKGTKARGVRRGAPLLKLPVWCKPASVSS